MTTDVKLDFNSTGDNLYDIEMVVDERVKMTLKSTLDNVSFDIVSGKLVLEFDAATFIHLPEGEGVRNK